MAIQSKMGSMEKRHQLNGLLFCLPALLGLAGLTLYPLCASLYYSFCNYPVLKPPTWVGLSNYRLIAQDIAHRGLLFESLYNSLFYSVFAVPVGIVVSLGLAMLLNQKVRGISLFRTVFYLPSIVPVVASSVLWLWLLNPQSGLVNLILQWTGIEHVIALLGIKTPLGWMADPVWSKPSLVLMSIWGVGNSTVIFLAGLQGVSPELYEAADLDGATAFSKTRNITIPMISPQLMFMLVMGMIGSFQYFTQAWIISNGTGSPANSTMMYPMFLFQNAFQYFKMGYACAMAWLMFLIVIGLTAIVFKSSARHVYYAGQ